VDRYLRSYRKHLLYFETSLRQTVVWAWVALDVWVLFYMIRCFQVPLDSHATAHARPVLIEMKRDTIGQDIDGAATASDPSLPSQKVSVRL